MSAIAIVIAQLKGGRDGHASNAQNPRTGGRAVRRRPVLREQQPPMRIALVGIGREVGGGGVRAAVVGQSRAAQPCGRDDARAGGISDARRYIAAVAGPADKNEWISSQTVFFIPV